MAIRKDKAAVLSRIADGWRPLRAQITGSKYYTDRGFLRLDWGPADSPDADKMCWHITPAGLAAIGRQ